MRVQGLEVVPTFVPAQPSGRCRQKCSQSEQTEHQCALPAGRPESQSQGDEARTGQNVIELVQTNVRGCTESRAARTLPLLEVGITWTL